MKTVRIITPAAVTLLSIAFATACTLGEVDEASINSSVETIEESEKQPQHGLPSPTTTADANQGSKSTASQSPSNDTALKGRTVYLDPGHAAVAPPASLTARDGRGEVKPCNTSGTEGNNGWPEYEFTWMMAEKLQKSLEEAGATVLLSRTSDGRADCIDERADKENASSADVVLSLHADGSSSGNSGFHISSISDPLPDNLADESRSLSVHLRNAMINAGLQASNYLGENGLYPRSDLSGLNLSNKPKVLIEFGNMRDAADLESLQSDQGTDIRAEAVLQGISDYINSGR